MYSYLGIPVILLSEQKKSVKFENNSCFSFIYVPIYLCVFWCWEMMRRGETRVNTAELPEIIQAKQTSGVLTRMRRVF